MNNCSRVNRTLYAVINDQEISKKTSFQYNFLNNAGFQSYLNNYLLNYQNNDPFVYPSNRLKIDNLITHLKNIDSQIYTDYLSYLDKVGVYIVTYNDPNYPINLKTIENPPLLLYIKGILSRYDNCISIVGTRNPSDYSRRKTREISRDLTKKGFTIVSGLASGIDTEAHNGAVESGGKTIAILPGNIEDIYPTSNRQLARKISETGALIAEISKCVKMHKGRYISRNRITSGISDCIVIIECHNKGGTMQQAETAVKQKKLIFILEPEDKNNIAIEGYNALIKYGAIPFTSPQEIIQGIKRYKNNTNNMTLNRSDIICTFDDF